MTLEILYKDMVQAMKDKHILKKEVLSCAIAAIKKTAIDKGCRDNITEELVNEVLLKEKKILQEQIDTCPEDREMMRAEYVTKLEYLDFYCPKLLNDPEAIRKDIRSILYALGIEEDKSNKGAIMKAVMPHFKGKADMKIVNQVIGDMLK